MSIHAFILAVKVLTVPRLTITLDEEQKELVDELSSDGGPYESKSEAVRNLIQDGERAQELERTVERLQNEKRALIENRQETTELANYVEEERSWRSAPISTRLKWWVFGRE
ncbi:ribbon-helix-helix protein, CopG family [Halomarina salina]|uniref:Ribbon-helix-helix protein, CopG family n=1 Tax=Halomarina salina TaxID=1872699 RepID=A0ABD5RU72_9EURY|nr:ribbon-helix-helix protein, CopG family [Halomarina salina]